MGRGFTSGGQELVFRAAVCKIKVRKCYIESLPLVSKDKRSCFSQGEKFSYSCFLVVHLPSGNRMLISDIKLSMQEHSKLR